MICRPDRRYQFGRGAAGTTAARIEGAFGVGCKRPQVCDGGICQFPKYRREGQTAITAEREIV